LGILAVDVMKTKRGLVLGFSILLLLALVLNATGVMTAVGEATWCAERTIDGAWCQNVPSEQINQDYRSAQTSCESTSFCKLGTCIDSSQGTCLENTPQRVCQENNGFWEDLEPEQIPQCQLGCCILGEEAAFVTQSRCEVLSSKYGLETNYRNDIKDEVSCIASASPQAKGACVIDTGFQRDCRFTTKANCNELQASSNNNVEFHEDFLCSAESLGTICGPSRQTTCVEGKDAVYYLDTCGNTANIYDSSRYNDKEYWTRIYDIGESCTLNPSLSNSASCGSCNYFAGSLCKEYNRGSSETPTAPNQGSYVCADLSCTYQGQDYEHGESWCATNTEDEDFNNLPGSEYFRMVCYNGEVTAEQCAPFRNEICTESIIEPDFSVAQCKTNRWQDCVLQESKNACEDTGNRDCQWLEGESLLTDNQGNALVVNAEGELVPAPELSGPFDILELKEATCVPLNAPGLQFWEGDSSQGQAAEELCFIASEDCVVRFEKDVGDLAFGSDWDCKENCHCLPGGNWEEAKNNLCFALGDCGSSLNYIGEEGDFDGKVVKIAN
jgi:hypothetical protein